MKHAIFLMKEAGLINMNAIDHEYPEGEWWER